MDRTTARDAIKSGVPCTDFLEESQDGLYCCPFCGSGHGANGTGALKYYPKTNTWTCFACPETNKKHNGGDVLKLYQGVTGCDYNTALNDLAQRLGITIDPYRIPANTEPRENATKTPRKDAGESTQAETRGAAQVAEEPVETADYRAYYRACNERLKDPAAISYLQKRGISLETAEAYFLGYDPAADPASAPGATGNEYKPHPCPRIIIPSCDGHYVARSIDDSKSGKFPKMNPSKEKGAASPAIFNNRVLYAQDVREVFVTEGAFDALSVLEIGAAAIALNSAANAEHLISQLEQRRTAATLILCLDHDKRGQAAEKTIREGLQRLNISFICADICGSHKDPNEALTADRVAFTEAVQRARWEATRPDNTSLYIETLMTAEIERFKRDKSTGFTELDKHAGGLYAGLYVLAALPSLGKTSLALQMADQLAAGGHDVLFFSLEQSRLELVTKSFARITAQNDPKTAVTSLAIRKGCLPAQVLQAAETYKKTVSDRLSVIEGNFTCDISYIGNRIRQHIERTNERPVVFIDYLQILQPGQDGNRRQTTKETIDTTVQELKRLTRGLDLTVIVISSVNRSNYLTPIDFESLKESGGIEFTADVVWGLQLQCLNEDLFDKKENIKAKRARIREAKGETPRQIELVFLKNRYGRTNTSIYFDYYPANDLFIETGAKVDEKTYTLPKAGRKL